MAELFESWQKKYLHGSRFFCHQTMLSVVFALLSFESLTASAALQEIGTSGSSTPAPVLMSEHELASPPLLHPDDHHKAPYSHSFPSYSPIPPQPPSHHPKSKKYSPPSPPPAQFPPPPLHFFKSPPVYRHNGPPPSLSDYHKKPAPPPSSVSKCKYPPPPARPPYYHRYRPSPPYRHAPPPPTSPYSYRKSPPFPPVSPPHNHEVPPSPVAKPPPAASHIIPPLSPLYTNKPSLHHSNKHSQLPSPSTYGTEAPPVSHHRNSYPTSSRRAGSASTVKSIS
ncbi:hypothetical protein O6H91_03G028500 [Diphasiastrum complanatum]|uniref:Uncharacterized protein n=1 Tax=Diphasiastrum complanatum TaxID=34168 RepID=A0ACC2E4F9_DIPCM|nr:hypothetical protein O6H91_03G028500 [Diphasiastrum complanatum]